MSKVHKPLSSALASVALLAAFLLCVGHFIYRANEESRQRAFQWLRDGAFYQSQVLKTQFEGIFGALATCAEMLSQKGLDQQDRVQTMRALRAAGNFDYVVLVDSRGMGMNHLGKENIDLTHRSCYQETRGGRRSIEYIRSGTVDKQRSFVGFALPITRDGVYVGAIYASYDVAYFVKLLATHNKDYSNYIKLIDNEGLELFTTRKESWGALDEKIRLEMRTLHRGKAAQDIEEGKGVGGHQYEQYGVTYYVTHAPLKVDGNVWYMVNVINASSAEVAKNTMDGYVVNLLLQLLVISCLYMVFFFRRDRLQKEMERLREEAEQASRAKGDFLARMSHEIRTPMNAIVHMARLGLESLNNGSDITTKTSMHETQGRMRGYLTKIDSASRVLLHLINDVLDLAALEGRKIQVDAAPFEFKPLLRSWCALYYDICHRKGLHFNLIFRGMDGEFLVGDAQRINQIVLNLLSNAVKFTPTGGGVTLSIDCTTKVDAERIRLLLKVEDTGCGIDEEVQERIFVPFEQGTSMNVHQAGSTGLGLAVALKMAKLMNGDLTVQSRPGEGSAFTLSLPLPMVPRPVLPELPQWQGKQSLLFSLQSVVRESVSGLLGKCGLVCNTADSREALQAMLQRMRMEGKSGSLTLVDGMPWPLKKVEYMQQLMALYPQQLGSVALIVHDVDEVRSEAAAAGIHRVLPKPLTLSCLHALLEDLDGREDDGFSQVQLAAALEERKAEKAQGGLANRRALLAEDNELNTEIAVEILHSFGMSVDCAEDGQQALNKLLAADNSYDIVVTDIQMPVMDGYALAGAIRACLLPHVAALPIIAVSANALITDVERSMAVGMNAHLPKPVDVASLREALEKALYGSCTPVPSL